MASYTFTSEDIPVDNVQTVAIVGSPAKVIGSALETAEESISSTVQPCPVGIEMSHVAIDGGHVVVVTNSIDEEADDVGIDTSSNAVITTPVIQAIPTDEQTSPAVQSNATVIETDQTEAVSGPSGSLDNSASVKDDIQNLFDKAASENEDVLCLYLTKDGRLTMGTKEGEKIMSNTNSLLAEFQEFCKGKLSISSSSEPGKEELLTMNEEAVPDVMECSESLLDLGKELVDLGNKAVDDGVKNVNDTTNIAKVSVGDVVGNNTGIEVAEGVLTSRPDLPEGGWDLGEWQIEREKCPHCNKTFKDKLYLKQHMDLHSDLNYLCPLCAKDFTMKRYVYMHAKRVHQVILKPSDRIETLEANLQCPQCPMKFAFESSRKDHIVRDHDVKKKREMKKSVKEKRRSVLEEEDSDEEDASPPKKRTKTEKMTKDSSKKVETSKTPKSKEVKVKEEIKSEPFTSTPSSSEVVGHSRSGRKIRFPGWKYADSENESTSPVKKAVEEKKTVQEKKEVQEKNVKRKSRGRKYEEDEEEEEEEEEIVEVVKRKRGRPKKYEEEEKEEEEEEEIVEEVRRKRGRPKKYEEEEKEEEEEEEIVEEVKRKRGRPKKYEEEEEKERKKEEVSPIKRGRGRPKKVQELNDDVDKVQRGKSPKGKSKQTEEKEDVDSDDSEGSKGDDGEGKEYKCAYCVKSFNLKRHLDRHVSDCHEHECKHCSKILHTKTDLNNHQNHCDRGEKTKKTKLSIQKTAIKCKVCGKWFRSQEALDKHGAVHQSMIRNCPQCDRNVTGNKNFQLHLRKNHPDIKEQEKIFKEIGITPKKCFHCKSPFIDDESMQQHIARFHSDCETERETKDRVEKTEGEEGLKMEVEEEIPGSPKDQEAALEINIEGDLLTNGDEEEDLEEETIDYHADDDDYEEENDKDDDSDVEDSRSFSSFYREKKERKSKKDGEKVLYGRCKVMKLGQKIGYNCLICNKMLSNRLTAIRHMERHDEELFYEHECKFCHMKFENRIRLGAHMRSMHMKTDAFACERCNEKFTTSTFCKEHMKTCKADPKDKEDDDNIKQPDNSENAKFETVSETKCIICGVDFDTVEDLAQHSNQHVTEDGTWFCPYCQENGGIFTQRSWLIQHIWKFHKLRHYLPDISSDPNNLTCKYCLKTLITPEALKKHLFLHEGKNLFCEICSKHFNYPYQLKNHMAIHNETAVYSCNKCHEKFKLKRYLQKHMKEVHNQMASKTHIGPRCNMCEETQHFGSLDDVFTHAHEHHKEKLEESLKKVNKENVEEFICRQCFKKYRTYKEYVIHVVCHTRRIPLMCETCGKYFDHKTKLRVHQTTHNIERNFECNICHNRYGSEYNLKAHMKRHTQAPAICETCGMTFKSKDTLATHARVHDETKRFSCDVCGYQTRTFDGYKCHLVAVHPEVAVTKGKWKIYTCEYCGKLSSGKQQYTRHIATHTGELPFECPHCDYKYATKGALNVHIRSHSDVEKPFYCEPCDLRFLWANKMQKHMESGRHLQACAQAGMEPEVVIKAFQSQFAVRRSKSNRGYHDNRSSGSRQGVKKINLCGRNRNRATVRPSLTRKKRPRMMQKIIYVSHDSQEVVEEESMETWGVYSDEVAQNEVAVTTTEVAQPEVTQEIQIVETQPTDEALQIATSMTAEELAQGNTEYVIITVPQDGEIDPRMAFDIQAAVQSILK